MVKRWNVKQDRELVRLRLKMPVEAVEAKLGRPVRRRLEHLRRLGHRLLTLEPILTRGRRTGIVWTVEEHIQVIELAKDRTLKDIADRLERTPLSVAYRIVIRLSEKHTFRKELLEEAQALVDEHRRMTVESKLDSPTGYPKQVK